MLRSAFRTAALGWSLIVLSMVSRTVQAEELFTEDVRIQTATDPSLLLDENTAHVWRLTGSGSEFSGFGIFDDTATTNPFFILPGAPNNSLVVDGLGNIASGPNGPFASFHISRNGAQAYIRLEADVDGTDPVNREAWDLNSFSDDFSGFAGFSLSNLDSTFHPLRVETQAQNDLIYLASNGSGMVGVGTSTPEKINNKILVGDARHLNLNAGTGVARLVAEGQTAAEMYMVHSGGLTGRKVVRTRVGGGKYQIGTLVDNLSANIEPAAFSIDLTTTNVGIKTVNPVKPLQVGDAGANDGNGAHVTSGGVWTNASSRSVKQDIEPITSQQARETVRALQPVGYRYKNELDEKYVGFIAEDVPELVATSDRKSLAAMDIVAVLTRVVQDQDRLLETERESNAEHRARLESQQRLIEKQQALLTALEQRLSVTERQLDSVLETRTEAK